MVLPLLIIGIMGWAAWKDAKDKLNESSEEKPKEKPKEREKTVDEILEGILSSGKYPTLYSIYKGQGKLQCKYSELNYKLWQNSPQRKDYLKTIEQFERPKGVGRNLDSDDFGGPKRVVYDNPIEISKYQNWRKINKL